MKVEIDDNDLVIKPENAQDVSWIKYELGLTKDGDVVNLRRCDMTVGFGNNARLNHLRARKCK